MTAERFPDEEGREAPEKADADCEGEIGDDGFFGLLTHGYHQE